MMKASGRAAVILVVGFFLAGLFLLFGGVAQAAPSSAASSKSDSAGKQADMAKPSKPRRHASRHRDNTKTAQKSDDKADKKDAAATADEAKADTREVPASSQMPPEVANANAQLAADTPTAAAASAMTGRANDNVQAAADNTAAPNAESQVVPPDQLNDIDRALQQDNAPAQKAVIAAIDAQPRPAPVMASSQQSSAWDQSSLIGKIFIGVGTLLTLASAARMFMA
jgi:cytoskeletal protein RodZ